MTSDLYDWKPPANSEMGGDNQLWRVGEPGDSGPYFVLWCIAPDCPSHCRIGRPDGDWVTIERAGYIAVRAGWSNISGPNWVCPTHNLQLKEDQ